MHKSFVKFIDCRVLDQYCEWENWEEEKEVLKSDCVFNEMNLLSCSLRDTIKGCNFFLITYEHSSML